VSPRVKNPRAGFTLIELLIVVTLIGIMSAYLLPKLRPTPARKVRESARQLARDLELARTRALSTKRATRIVVTTTGAGSWVGYRDETGDNVIDETAAERDSLRAFGVRTLDGEVQFGRGTANPLPGWPLGDPTSFTGGKVNFASNGMTSPFGAQGVIYVRSRSNPALVSAIAVSGAGSIRVWTYKGGTWQ
jgi:type II secretion system protein H